MNISQIYEKFQIMPQLQEHMLRVAGVALIICNNFEKKVNKNIVLSALLLHDIGSIVKFDLDFTRKIYPALFKVESINHWESIQKEFIKKYGNDDYHATYLIAKELGVRKNVSELIKNIEFTNMAYVAKSSDFLSKISIYSDARVSTKGVVLLPQRLAEVKSRWIKRRKVTQEFFEKEISKNAMEIEKQVFDYCRIKPEYITEKNVRQLFGKLRNFEIQTRSM